MLGVVLLTGGDATMMSRREALGDRQDLGDVCSAGLATTASGNQRHHPGRHLAPAASKIVGDHAVPATSRPGMSRALGLGQAVAGALEDIGTIDAGGGSP